MLIADLSSIIVLVILVPLFAYIVVRAVATAVYNARREYFRKRRQDNGQP